MLTRLAPTPSGYLHKGNVYNFLLNWLWAKSNGGKVLLRIDDGDTERKRKEYVEDIFRVLDWLGLDWDIGPTGPDDFEQHWSQSHRKDLYENILNELVEKNMLFACACSRKEQCNCIEKNIPLSQPGAAWKIKITPDSIVSFNDKISGDIKIDIADTGSFAVKRKDGIAAYQVCSLADDKHFGVTHICRGNDLAPSTAMQLYIDKQLSTSYFNTCQFWHHSLLTDNAGNKFSKSTGTIGSSIINQINKEELFSSFARWMGFDNKMTLKDMVGVKKFITD